MDEQKIKEIVRKGYADIAVRKGAPCCGGADTAKDVGEKIGYSKEELSTVPEGANLGLGCGNPVALASLKEGDIVLDLGSGAGFDCFLSANRVGERGRVIGVDITPEMIEKARINAEKGSYENVEFRLGEIEKLPVEDRSVDVVISNCVINLSPDKKKVFSEIFRVLKPGGRMMISDIVLDKELPSSLRNSIEAYVGCLAGAVLREEYLEAISAAGFQDAKVVEDTSFPLDCMINDPTAKAIMDNLNFTFDQLKDFEGTVSSIKVLAIKN